MEIWFYGFWIIYAVFIFTAYKAFIHKIYKKIRYGNRFLHYHIIDTGDYGDFVFSDGENTIDGKPRIYSKDSIVAGTLFYEYDNVEPIKVKRDLKLYKYFCDTKNFDTVARNDILQTLLILHAKEILMALIAIGIIVSFAGIIATWYFTNSMQAGLNDQFGAIKEQISHLAKVGS